MIRNMIQEKHSVGSFATRYCCAMNAAIIETKFINKLTAHALRKFHLKYLKIA